MAEIQLGYSANQINSLLTQVSTNQTNINKVIERDKFFNNISVATNKWEANNTYPEYPYRATVALTGVTLNHFPEVIFNIADAESGIFAPLCQSYGGGIYIYAAYIPLDTITIPVIKCTLTSGVI